MGDVAIEYQKERDDSLRRQWIELRARRAMRVCGTGAPRALVEMAVAEDPRLDEADRPAVVDKVLEIWQHENVRHLEQADAEAVMKRARLDKDQRARILEHVKARRANGGMKAPAVWREVMEIFGVDIGRENFLMTYWHNADPARHRNGNGKKPAAALEAPAEPAPAVAEPAGQVLAGVYDGAYTQELEQAAAEELAPEPRHEDLIEWVQTWRALNPEGDSYAAWWAAQAGTGTGLGLSEFRGAVWDKTQAPAPEPAAESAPTGAASKEAAWLDEVESMEAQLSQPQDVPPQDPVLSPPASQPELEPAAVPAEAPVLAPAAEVAVETPPAGTPPDRLDLVTAAGCFRLQRRPDGWHMAADVVVADPILVARICNAILTQALLGQQRVAA